jgi:CRISPR-associated protein Csm3
MNKLEKKIEFTGKLTLMTGLHIGDSDEHIQIGGLDNSVVRRVDGDRVPYIPGSSLRGKIRCLLEQVRGISVPGTEPIDFKNPVSGLFGKANDKDIKASRLIVRDSFMTSASMEALKKNPNTDFPFTEVKFEVAIDRIAGSAKGGAIHKNERVPAGSVFNVSFVLNVWSDESEADHVNLLQEGIRLLEADYLGGSGSRGYGQVKLDMDWKGEVLYPAAAAGADKVAGV